VQYKKETTVVVNGSEEDEPKQRGWKPVQLILLIHSIGLFSLFGWLFMVSYYLGERANQMDVNTKNIEELQRYGSNGVQVRLKGVEDRLERIENLLLERK
jgi:hypothetical protein